MFEVLWAPSRLENPMDEEAWHRVAELDMTEHLSTRHSIAFYCILNNAVLLSFGFQFQVENLLCV